MVSKSSQFVRNKICQFSTTVHHGLPVCPVVGSPAFLWVTLRNSIASIAMENGPVNRTDFYDVPVQISTTILIFHGYVKLPNGKPACEKYPAPLPKNQVALPPFSYLQSILIGSRKWVV